MKAIVVTHTVVCKTDIPRLWPHISDTDRLNYAAGLAEVTLKKVSSDRSPARYEASSTLGGFRVRWEEEPYEWTFERHFGVRRRMLTGPLTDLRMDFYLSARPDGCEVQLTNTLVPRFGLLAPIIRRQAARALAQLAAEVVHIDNSIQAGLARPVERKQPLVSEGRLQTGLASMRSSVSVNLLERIERFIRAADDLQVAAIRPFVLADQWGCNRTETLQMFMRAADANLVDTRWQIICPSCRVPSETMPSLAEVEQHAECHFCDIKFAANLEESVELVFQVNNAIRSSATGTYCVGGPARTPHVLAQGILPANGAASLNLPLLPGRYRLFVRGGAECTVQVTDGAAMESTLSCHAISRMDVVTVAPGGVLRMTNPGDKSLHAKLETLVWSSQATSAGDIMKLTSTSSPILPPGWAA